MTKEVLQKRLDAAFEAALLCADPKIRLINDDEKRFLFHIFLSGVIHGLERSKEVLDMG